MSLTRHAARVCVDGFRECTPTPGQNTESQDVEGSGQHQRLVFAGYHPTHTTTNYILGLVSSSSRNESKSNLSLVWGGSCV